MIESSIICIRLNLRGGMYLMTLIDTCGLRNVDDLHRHFLCIIIEYIHKVLVGSRTATITTMQYMIFHTGEDGIDET